MPSGTGGLSARGGVEANEWNGVFFPANVPAAIVHRLSAAMDEAIAAPTVAARLMELNAGTRRNTPEQALQTEG